MTVDVAAFERSLHETLEVFGGLTADEMAAPSACAGWTVHTVLAHLTGGIAGIAGLLRQGGYAETDDLEELADARARELAARPAGELLELLRLAVPKAVGVFGALPDELAGMPVCMGTAGTYPFARMASALTFDHTCHVRFDLLAPRGPVRRVLPDLDEARVAACVSWLVGGIPRMTTDEFRARLTDPLDLVLRGGREPTSVRLEPADGLVAVGSPGGAGGPRALVRSTGADFILWGTGREPYDGRVAFGGDEAYARRVLAAFRVY
jgi:uncharacterized protein (TIGR03083 family)